VDVIRAKFSEILKQSDKWDGRIAALQVTDFKDGTMELRCLMSARTASQTFDLRCEVREKLIAFLQKEHPEALAHIAPDQPQGSARGTEDAALAGEPLKRIRPA
jgi:hypothetical protein